MLLTNPGCIEGWSVTRGRSVDWPIRFTHFRVAIKGPDLSLPFISDLSLGAEGSIFKGSLSLPSLLQLVVDSSPSFHPSIFSLPPSIHLLSSSLSNTPSFIFFLSLQVSSSWLLFPTPAASPVASSLLPGSHSSLVKRSWRVLTSFFNGCYTCYGQPCHSLPSLSAFSLPFSYYYFIFVTHSCFSFLIQVSSLLPPGQLNPVVLFDALRLSLWFMLPCGFNFSRHFPEATPTQKEQTGRTDQTRNG